MARGPNPLKEWRAKRAFENFTGRKPSRLLKTDLDDGPQVGYALGDMVGVAYEATRDGKKDQYFHRFKKQARPVLGVRDDGKQLYVAGGDYHVTDRGIEDMPELFLVNPSRPIKRRRRRSSAQPKRKAVAMRSNPARRRRRRSVKRTVTTFRRNPVRRRGVRRARTSSTYRRNPIRHRRRAVSVRRYRRNPSGGGFRGKGTFKILPMIMPAISIGIGAVGAELVMGYLPLPAMLKTGPVRFVTKGAVSVGIGMLIAKFGSRKLGELFAMGGLAIAAHDAVKDTLTKFMPGAQFGQYMGGANWNDYGYNLPIDQYNSYPGVGYYSPADTMGEYMGDGDMAGATDYEFAA